MRLRHKKWTNTVLEENKDIGLYLDSFDKEILNNIDYLEIGSGLGQFLLSLSENNQDKNCLGVEINLNAFASSLKKAAEYKKEITNFKFINSPIDKLLPMFKDKSICNIYINFPDPWPKKKQQHRRLSYPTFLEEYNRILKEGGKVYFRTDNIDLFNDSIEYFENSNLFDVEIIQPFYSENVDYLYPTEYEKKFREKGVMINLLIATKK